MDLRAETILLNLLIVLPEALEPTLWQEFEHQLIATKKCGSVPYSKLGPYSAAYAVGRPFGTIEHNRRNLIDIIENQKYYILYYRYI